jgi:hypothetical protein
VLPVERERRVKLINPIDAFIALMAKWVLKAYEQGSSNPQVMIRFMLSNFQPYSRGHWIPSVERFTQCKFQAKKRPKAWNRVGISWRALVQEVVHVSAIVKEEVLNDSFWWLGGCTLQSTRFHAFATCILCIYLTSIHDDSSIFLEHYRYLI